MASSPCASFLLPLLTDSLISQAIIDQRSLARGVNLPESTPFLEVVSAKTLDTLKPLYLLVCPPLMDVFILQELKWSKNSQTQSSLSFDML